jgi:DtxR family Mn-dependent transcriptional regulator
MRETISQSMGDYLRTIYKLGQRQEGGPVTTSLIAEKMDVAPASATNMIKKLAQMRLLVHAPYRGVELTSGGTKVALETIRHHRLLELYLNQALGYSWDEVDAEADRLEHAISEEFEDRIDAALGYPKVGAHGEPIPSKQGNIETNAYRPLADLEVGSAAIIREVSDRNPEMLRYIGEMGLQLGTDVEVRTKAPFQGPLQLVVGEGRDCSLGLEVARHIFVEQVA